MLNIDRLAAVQEHVKEAQRLAAGEAHASCMDRRVTRLALGLHLCRELADDILEDALGAENTNGHRIAPGGRMERTHL